MANNVCSASMGSLGSSAALRQAAATSLGLGNGMQANQMHTSLPPGLPPSGGSLPMPDTAHLGRSTPAPAEPAPQSQPLTNGVLLMLAVCHYKAEVVLICCVSSNFTLFRG